MAVSIKPVATAIDVREDMLASVGDHDVAVNWTKGGVRKDELDAGSKKWTRHSIRLYR